MDGGRVLILGAGHAGVGAAAALRQAGHAGEIILTGDEDVAGYNRPPLSKAWLKGEAALDDILLRPAKFYQDQNTDLRLGARASRIDRDAKAVSFEDGQRLDYDALIIATGARARPLPDQKPLLHMLSLRSLRDAEEIRQALGPGRTLCIIGGGYIGLEVAASARALNCEVIVIEREERLLPRVAGADLAGFFHQLHEGAGVRFETSATVAGLRDDGGVISGVELSDGRILACDALLVGIGAIANIELAQAAGLDCANGVTVDIDARTSDPSIFAIGDIAWRPLPLYEDRMFRLESVPNALEQGRQAAAAICGKPRPAPETPWFWSDQYDVKLQIAGLAVDCDRTIVRGDPDAKKFSIVHLAGDRVRAVEAVNAAPDFMAGRMMIAKGQRVALDKVGDASVMLKDCVVPD